MPAQFQNHEVPPDMVVLKIAGSINEERDLREVEARVDGLLRKNCKKVVFDLSGVQYMDSLGVGAIVMCSAKLRKSGGELRVAGAWGMVDEILRLTRVNDIVKFYTSTRSATEEEFVLPD
ncbi:MAG TPA: STAS domain-containing protein [Sphingomonadales bacterium]|nr:STAS domain-containing protein [Sphingomonadales bacterium]